MKGGSNILAITLMIIAATGATYLIGTNAWGLELKSAGWLFGVVAGNTIAQGIIMSLVDH